ncbi:hypothetical protein [Peribacillus simplex]|uniref:hypothetical protein n=1 Tax=Peribacillus simplex TaxID=1478 RepID=UPI0024C1A294|nr:hypothetical protein [Peribacillus simplex]WHX91202.1 hypothetical protein QNH50_25235 [Peribacillus simplex]
MARKQAKEEAAEKPEGEMDIAKQKAAAAAQGEGSGIGPKTGERRSGGKAGR